MKKTILSLLFVFTVGFVYGQNDIKDIKSVNFYGIDFSLVQVYGADESPQAFIRAFEGINSLMMDEPDKYDLEKAFRKDFQVKDIGIAVSHIDIIDKTNLITDDREYKLLPHEIQQLINIYDTKEKEGAGMIFVAEMLNKKSDKGYYHIVFFDIETKEIIYSKRMQGKTGGFGLRNFWAHSIFDILKNWSYR